jgi:hypothetical protein
MHRDRHRDLAVHHAAPKRGGITAERIAGFEELKVTRGDAVRLYWKQQHARRKAATPEQVTPLSRRACSRR